MAQTSDKKTEKAFTVPMDNVLSAPQRARADRAVTEIRSYLARHMRTKAKFVKVGEALNLLLWKNGPKGIPSKVKIHAKFLEDNATIVAELADVPFPVSGESGSEKKKEKPKEKPAQVEASKAEKK